MASVDKRPSGQWRARWREYPGGPQKTKHFARKIDAEQHLVKVQYDLMTGAYVDPKKARTTVADYYAVWEPRQPWRPSTRDGVHSTFATHVLPALGKRPLGTIRRGDLETWAARLPLSARTAGMALERLGTMFEAAVDDGHMAKNPTHRAKRPRVEAEPVVPFTPGQLELMTATVPGWFRVVITLGAACGLRHGEATGLTVDRVDFLRREMKIDRQLVTPARGKPAFGPLKTATSYRTVPLADVALHALAAHLEAFGTGQDGLVVHKDGRGQPIPRQRFDYVWRSARVKCGLPAESRFHDTRHTYASVLLSGGVSVPATAEYMGHTPAVLLRTYAHLIPGDHDRARSVVQAAFAKSAEDDPKAAED